MASSRPPRPSAVVTDITADFNRASSSEMIQRIAITRDLGADLMSALRTGQLVKDEFFQLFDAVPSLEIMDPKMDSGCLDEGETFDSDYDVSRPLSKEEVVGIMDRMLAHEIAWHSGEPLATTLYTSSYIDHLLSISSNVLADKVFQSPESQVDENEYPLVHLVLRSYCLATIKCLNLVYEQVRCEMFYEEEDFNTSLFNRNLLSMTDPAEIYPLLEDAVRWCSREASRSPKDAAILEAVRRRLLLRQTILQAIQRPVDAQSKTASKYWSLCETLIGDIQETSSFGNEPDGAVSPKLQRKLASTAPPRPVNTLNTDLAFPVAKQLYKDCREIVTILQAQSTADLMTFIWTIQGRQIQPLTYPRAILQSCISRDNQYLMQYSMKRVTLTSMQELCLLSSEMIEVAHEDIEFPEDPRFQMNRLLDTFITKAASALINMAKGLCQNRCRMRRNVTHLIIDWDALQVEGEQLDDELRYYTKEQGILDPDGDHEPAYSYPFSSWVYYYKIMQMEWTVQLGFETQIYHVDELSSMYWYLSRLLLVREEHLLRIRGFALRRLLPDPSQAEYSDLLEELTDLHQLYSTIEYTSSLRTLAFAFSCVYTLMEQLDLLKGAAKPFGSRASRHELRFKPFLSVSLPELPSLQEFEGRLEFGMNGAAKTLEIARGAMGRAKAGLESQLKLHDKRKQTESSGGLPNGKILEMKNQEVEGVMRSCIAMGLVLDRLRRGMESRTVDELRLEMGGVLPWEAGTGLYHRWWIVPTLGPSKAKQPTPAAGAQAKGEEQAVMESNAK